MALQSRDTARSQVRVLLQQPVEVHQHHDFRRPRHVLSIGLIKSKGSTRHTFEPVSIPATHSG